MFPFICAPGCPCCRRVLPFSVAKPQQNTPDAAERGRRVSATGSMSRFAKFATGLREFGNDINANISKALNISKVRRRRDNVGVIIEVGTNDSIV